MSLRPAAAVVTVVLALFAAPAALARDVTLPSFDGTPIVAHWFPLTLPAGQTAPTVLMGPGWGSPGDVNEAGMGGGPLGVPGIARLHAAGYNVLTWDPRGFGQSGGTVEVDSADFEGRDAQMLLDYVAAQPEAQLDAPGDPRVGMAGASYGGGIQLVLAAIDPRVDAIVPVIAWHSLGTSLYKTKIVKEGWASFLYRVAASRSLDPHIRSAYEQGLAVSALQPADEQWFLDRGPGDALVSRVKIPTLLVQGTVDTLFTLDEAVANYTLLRSNGVPVHMLWACDGHGVCLTKQGPATRAVDATMAWLKRYVQRDASVDTGPGFDWIDQNGKRFTATRFALEATPGLVGGGRGVLKLTARGGAGPIDVPAGAGGLGAAMAPITPGRAKNAVNVKIRAKRAATVLGWPTVTLRYRGRVAAGARPVRVFAQLVDDDTGVVVGNQITPIPLVLDGRRHEIVSSLEIVGQSVAAGHSLTLQIVASTVAYAQPRLGGSVRFDRILVGLPTLR